MNAQIIYFQSQVIHLPFMFLKSTDFKFSAKIIGGNYVFCCSSHISFNPTSHLNVYCSLKERFLPKRNIRNVLFNTPVLYSYQITLQKTFCISYNLVKIYKNNRTKWFFFWYDLLDSGISQHIMIYFINISLMYYTALKKSQVLLLFKIDHPKSNDLLH